MHEGARQVVLNQRAGAVGRTFAHLFIQVAPVRARGCIQVSVSMAATCRAACAVMKLEAHVPVAHWLERESHETLLKPHSPRRQFPGCVKMDE